VEDEPLAGRPSTSKKDDSVERVRSYRRLTFRMISRDLNLNRFTVHQILTRDLDMRKMRAKIVPKNLTTEQKANRTPLRLLRLICENSFFEKTGREKQSSGTHIAGPIHQ
jgi:hypothetical protein